MGLTEISIFFVFSARSRYAIKFQTIVCYAEVFFYELFLVHSSLKGWYKGQQRSNHGRILMGDLPHEFCIFLFAYWQRQKLNLTLKNSILSSYEKLT